MAYQNRQPPEGINYVESGWQKDFVLLVVGFFAALALLTWLLLVLLGWAARWIPFGWEQALTESLSTHTEPDPRQAYLQNLAEDLARAGGLDPALEVTLHYQPDNTVNAYATLGGHLFIADGLLKKVKTQQGLAFVLAHEMAHVHYRHPVRAASRQMGLSLVTALIFGNNNLGGLASTGGHLAMLEYSREQERQADTWALSTVNHHYGHVAGAETLFQWLAENGSKTPAWLSTHPDTQARLASLQQYARAQGYALEGDLTPLPQWD